MLRNKIPFRKYTNTLLNYDYNDISLSYVAIFKHQSQIHNERVKCSYSTYNASMLHDHSRIIKIYANRNMKKY